MAPGGSRVARRKDHAHNRMLTAAALAIALALSPVVAAYLRVRQAQGFTRTRGEMVAYSATPPPTAPCPRHSASGRTCCQSVVTSASCFRGSSSSSWPWWVVAGRPTPVVRIYSLVAVSAFLLTLGPEPDVGIGRWPTGPYDWLLALPGVGGLRVPARFAIVVYLGFSVLAGAGAAWLLSRTAPRLALAAVVCLTLATLVEGLPVVRLSSTASQLSLASDTYQWLRRQPRGPMLELPVGQTHESVRYLAATLVHGNRIVNGYSGHGSALEDVFGGPPSGEPHNAGELFARRAWWVCAISSCTHTCSATSASRLAWSEPFSRTAITSKASTSSPRRRSSSCVQ